MLGAVRCGGGWGEDQGLVCSLDGGSGRCGEGVLRLCFARFLGGACYHRGRASYLRGCPSQGPPTPQGLHIPRVPGASYPGAIPVERPEHPITGADLYLGARCASFRGATFPGARAGHFFGAAYSPGGGTWPVQRGHLSLGLPGTSYHMGRLSQGCPEQSKRAAFLHMHCSHLSGLRCGTLVGWWHVIDLGTTWLVDDLRPRFSFQLSETARRRRRVVWALGLLEHTTCACTCACACDMHMCHVVGMGWSFVVQGAHDQTLLAIVRRAVCAQPARAPPSDCRECGAC